MFKRLLVPVDGSAPSKAAVTLAVDLARDQRARVIFAHVTEQLVEEYAAFEGTAVLVSDAAEHVTTKAMLDQAKSAAARAGVDASTEVVHGEVVQSVLNLAQERGVDLIVMGSHGRSGMARALIGSKTEGVMRRSRIPLLVAPHRSAVRTLPSNSAAARFRDGSASRRTVLPRVRPTTLP